MDYAVTDYAQDYFGEFQLPDISTTYFFPYTKENFSSQTHPDKFDSSKRVHEEGHHPHSVEKEGLGGQINKEKKELLVPDTPSEVFWFVREQTRALKFVIFFLALISLAVCLLMGFVVCSFQKLISKNFSDINKS